jgi:hypothetical protein
MLLKDHERFGTQLQGYIMSTVSGYHWQLWFQGRNTGSEVRPWRGLSAPRLAVTRARKRDDYLKLGIAFYGPLNQPWGIIEEPYPANTKHSRFVVVWDDETGQDYTFAKTCGTLCFDSSA